ncbi:hypothetical protein GWK47_031493 [Chionoecetes opilio]|uniref:Uncharacterized protein n=1 Tax=Chionoecetes opilio TaxID=41210 RepID=A0A8J4YV28_CHIOP|nr:hypothetical protein GWK47_031493 [Chionoecetes opilio]
MRSHDRSHGHGSRGRGGHVLDLHQVEEEAARDEEYRLLRECEPMTAGRNERTGTARLRQYSRCGATSPAKGTSSFTPVTRNTRLVIPAALRRAVLANLHAGTRAGLYAKQGEAVSLLARD